MKTIEKVIILVLIAYALCGCKDKSEAMVIDPNSDKGIYIQFCVPDVNSVDDAASALREYFDVHAKEEVDIMVVLGDETHTASFEDFFEWMGFKR